MAVLAIGDYGASYDMLVTLDPENEGIMPTSESGVTGDGIVIAQELRAHVTSTGYQPMTYAVGDLGARPRLRLATRATRTASRSMRRDAGSTTRA